MKRKTSTCPTRIYSYGARPPIDGAEHMEDQLRRGHRYRNGLVEIERRRRERIAAVQREHDRLGPLLEIIASLESLVGELRGDAKRARTGGKSQWDRDGIASMGEQIDVLLADLAVLRSLRSWCKAQIKATHELQALYDAVAEQSKIETKALRAGDEAPYWGTYLSIEQAAEAWRKAPDAPRFERYAGEGRCVVQIQGGLTVAELLSGQDTRLRLLPAPALRPPVNPVSPRQIARAIAYGVVAFCRGGDMTDPRGTAVVKLRVASRGRDPIWLAIPIMLHRPLPDDGVIKWAWLLRRRDGVRYRYAVQFVVEAESWRPRPRASAAVVALDIGCRDVDGGTLRTATWLDGDGARGEVAIQRTRRASPSRRGKGRRWVPNDLGKAEDLQSIRSQHFDAIRDLITAYKVAAGASATSPTPRTEMQWLREATEHIPRWRSPGRLVVLRRNWQRHAGDEEIVAAIDAYVIKDRHLIDWESNERRRFSARRRCQYREVAAHLAARYSTIVIAKRDYRRQEPLPEEAVSTQGTDGRSMLRMVAAGELREEIKRAAGKRGATVVEHAIEGDTAWAVDWRVCARLLAASGVVVPDRGEVLAPVITRPSPSIAQAPRRRRLGTAERRDPLASQDVTPRCTKASK